MGEVFIDPILLSKITYIDKDGVRRVKNPYKNRKQYCIITQTAGIFTFIIPEDLTNKSVLVNFPNGQKYEFTIESATSVLTIYDIPLNTYVEITVVNPVPLPPSEDDLVWDELSYESKKMFIAAWGDIEYICNVVYPATADSEKGFDEQNTLKYGLVGFRNNCSNTRLEDKGRPKPPPNGIYVPPEPEIKPLPEIGHDFDYLFKLRWEDGTDTDLDFYAFVDRDYEKYVGYDSKNYEENTFDKMWLDYDYTSHGATGYLDEPEIITILGMESHVISIQVHCYDGGTLTKNFTVEVIDILGNTIKTYDCPYNTISETRMALWVCDFDVKTKKLTDVMKVVDKGTF